MHWSLDQHCRDVAAECAFVRRFGRLPRSAGELRNAATAYRIYGAMKIRGTVSYQGFSDDPPLCAFLRAVFDDGEWAFMRREANTLEMTLHRIPVWRTWGAALLSRKR